MFAKWLRENNIAAGLLTVIRVWLGYNWMTAGWGKLTGEGFDASGYLKNAVAKQLSVYQESIQDLPGILQAAR